MSKYEVIKKYFSYIIGLFLIGISFNMIFLPNQYFSFNFLSLGIISNNFIDPILIILFMNIFIYLLSYLFIEEKKKKEFIFFILVLPVMLYLTKDIPNFFNNVDKLQTILIGSVLTGYGYGLIYRFGLIVDGMDLLNYVLSKNDSGWHKYINLLLNITLLGVCYLLFGFEKAIYSSIIYFIVQNLSNHVNLGISDSKTFCIVTEKYKNIKKYITENLNENITIVDVEGGFSKEPKKMIMTVINTKDYYALREKVQELDNEAFITILDSYQVIAKKRPKKNNQIVVKTRKKQ